MSDKKLPTNLTQHDKNRAAIKKLTDQIGILIDSGGLRVPKNYDPKTSLGLAAIQIGETFAKKKEGNNWVSYNVIEICTKQSIINSILYMLQGGFNPTKHGSFRSYGDVLKFDVNYQGKTMVAKRDGEVISSDAQVVFKDDDFDYCISTDGVVEIIKHKQTLQSRSTPIIGAYCVVTFADGRKVTEIMNIEELEAALSQNKNENPAQKKFKAEMCRKVVKNRAHKPIIEAADDSSLFHDEDYENQDKALADIQHEIKTVEYQKFEEIEETAEKKQAEQVQKPQPEEEDPF